MGERLTRLTIEAFRGVSTEWVIEWPRGASMVVRGDNGTGKSTIADALEWFYAGRIEFLAREGRERSIRHQGSSLGRPTRIVVETDGTTGGTRELPASNAGSPWAARRVADNVVLRGRTLSDFVEKPKADKFRILAQILGLQDADRLRQDLQTTRNQLDEAANAKTAERRRAAAALRPAIGQVDGPHLLAAIADRCRAADLAEPASVTDALDPGWLPLQVTTGASGRSVAVAGLLADVTVTLETSPAVDGVETWNAYLASTLPTVPQSLRLAQAADALQQVRAGDGRCPLCGQPVDDQALAERITAMLAELKEAENAHANAERQLRGATTSIRAHATRLGDLRSRAIGAGLAVAAPPEPPTERMTECQRTATAMPLASVHAFLASAARWLGELRTQLDAAITPGSSDGPLIELATLCEQGRRWQGARAAELNAVAAAGLAARLHDACQRIENDRYRSILATISVRVAHLYAALHPDEDLGSVAIEPWTDKGLELVVEFHGERRRPPHGVLSESHLNSLAVALFLAMAELFNDTLDVVVLDDVINSFDIEHRGRLAELLVGEFGHRQVIVLTHDQQFFSHLARRAPHWLTMELTSWSYDEGPRLNRYSSGRLIASARQALDDGDVQGAGHKTRRALEELLGEACESMEAALPFRRGPRNDRRELGELLSGLRGRLKAVSRDWYVDLGPVLTGLDADVQAALNIEVHAGRGWSSPSEIQAALDRLSLLEAAFTCPSCDSRIWALGDKNGGRCKCGLSVYAPIPNPRIGGPAIL